MKYLFTSESVTEGHPDKICDQISDSILDYCLKLDKNSRVAIETAIKNKEVYVFGEITTKKPIDLKKIVKTIKKILKETTESDKYKIHFNISKQSPNIAQGVDKNGAGDQGIMFGYATNETKEMMPLPILLAHKLAKQLSEVRKKKKIKYLKPDGKTQVTIEYENNKPKRIHTILISTQHKKGVSQKQIKEDLIKKVIKPICLKYMDKDTKILINPTGSFIVGGPEGDSGLTGRKIIVDTYGGIARHGGGAFSGKDATKVDRSATYMARYVAKHIVASGLAEKCEIQLSYAIGKPEPISIFVETFGTGKLNNGKISGIIKKVFKLDPQSIIKELDLRKPIFSKTATYGHFGRKGFKWESIDKNKVKEIRKLIKKQK